MFQEELTSCLTSIDSFGLFSTGGVATELCTSLPGIRINGMVDEIPLPVTTIIANEIKKIATIAPFGKGYDTVVDETVRKAWEIDAKLISFDNKQWDTAIQQLANRVGIELGCCQTTFCITPILYKALLYETGGHFKSHKDTEKEDKMFATLVVQLPSNCTGGTLVTKHQKEVRAFDFGQATGQAKFSTHYAAHYADVEHELLPVTSGYRFVLTYSLCWNGGGGDSLSPPPSLGSFYNRIGDLTTLLSNWVDMKDFTISTCPVGIVLEHEYTERTMNSGTIVLKGHDDVIMKVLMEANTRLDQSKKIKIYIATLSRSVSYYAESCGGCYDDDIEWCEKGSYNNVEKWIDTNGTVVPGVIKFNFKNLIDLQEEDDGFQDDDDWWGEPYKEDIEMCTGNEGPSKDTVYKKYAILIYPESTEFESVLMQKGIDYAASSLQHFLNLVNTSSTLSANDPAAVVATQKFNVILKHWTDGYSVPTYYWCARNTKGTGIALVDIVTSLNNVQLALDFVRHISTKTLTNDEELELVKLVQFFKWEPLADTLRPVLLNLSSFIPIVNLLRNEHVPLSDPIIAAVINVWREKVVKYSNTDQFIGIWDFLNLITDKQELQEFINIHGNDKNAENLVIQLLKRNNDIPTDAPFWQLFDKVLATTSSSIYHSDEIMVLIWKFLIITNDSDRQTKFAQCIVTNTPTDVLSILLTQLTTTTTTAKDCVKYSQTSPLGILLVHRIQTIGTTRTPSIFSWAMPTANIPNHPLVTTFLHDPKRDTMTYAKFNILQDARNWANEHFGYGTGCPHSCSTYSATSTVGGHGSSAYVTVTKTKDYFVSKLDAHTKEKTEQQHLNNLLLEPIDLNCKSTKRHRSSTQEVI